MMKTVGSTMAINKNTSNQERIEYTTVRVLHESRARTHRLTNRLKIRIQNIRVPIRGVRGCEGVSCERWKCKQEMDRRIA